MKLVLTGSIGMGKSTVAKMFAAHGIAMWSADAVVKSLYSEDGDLIKFIAENVPEAISESGIDFDIWRSALREHETLLDELEAIIHPKVAAHREEFVEQNDPSICEIPLYFENGEQGNFDHVIVVSANEEVQRERVLARGTMNEEDFEFILSRQVPDEIKRTKADFVIRTDCPLEETQAQVHDLLNSLGVLNA